MVYSNKESFSKVSLLGKAIKKIGHLIAKSFPWNDVRVLGLKLSGYKVGKKVYIGPDLIVANLISENTCKLVISDRVAIGPRVTLILSSDANWSKLMDKIEPIRGTIIMEDDCWIGACAVIMPNITIGKGSIVGAGAVVTKNVPPYSVVVGVPAKVIRKIDYI